MTLEVYNISNGIPMGKAVIGGGNVEADGMIYQFMGSVATYTALLALDTTDFKPGYVYDVQEDGMDYAWNGTGWNSLGGTHADLSNYQVKLTPNDPLSIRTYAMSNLVGMVYNSDATTVYTDPNTVSDYRGVYTYGATGNRLLNVDARNYMPTTDLPSLHDLYEQIGYIDIPYSFGQVANVSNLSFDSYGSFTLGKVSGEDYIQILAPQFGGSSSYPWYWELNHDNTGFTVAYDYTYGGKVTTATSQTRGAFDPSKSDCSDALGTLIQLIDNGDSVSVRFKIGNMLYTYTFTDGQQCARVREINTVRIFASNQRGYDASTAYQISSIGLYNTDTPITGEETSYDAWGENLFDISGVQERTYLDLHIGSGLALQNGNLVVDSTATVMTSGDQTIGGAKYFSDLQSESVYISGGEAAWLSYVSSGGAVLGRPDANHITLPTNSQDLIQVTRGGSTYTNVDSGNIVSYITGVDSTFSDESTNALQNKVITDSLMDFNNGSYVIYGSPTINSDVISNLSTTNYIETKYKFNCTSSDTWSLTVWISGFDATTSPFVLTNSVDGTKSIEMGFSGEKAYLKASSDGSTWDIADAVISDSSSFLGGNEGFRIEYNNGYIYTWQSHPNGYSTQYRSFSGVPYNTNSPIRIYSSVTDNTLSIDLSKSAMSVNNVTVWDGAAGELICTPKFPQSSDIRTIDRVTQAEYDALVQAGTVDASTLYIIV